MTSQVTSKELIIHSPASQLLWWTQEEALTGLRSSSNSPALSRTVSLKYKVGPIHGPLLGLDSDGEGIKGLRLEGHSFVQCVRG